MMTLNIIKKKKAWTASSGNIIRRNTMFKTKARTYEFSKHFSLSNVDKQTLGTFYRYLFLSDFMYAFPLF